MRISMAIAALALPLVASAQPLTTAFTYQGELTDGTTPANGTYDLRFRVCDNPVTCGGGTGYICADNVSVVNGRFVVALDFGAVFLGNQGFLEIDVRADTGLGCGDATGFATLSPRQSLTATPHAIFSLSAANADNAGSLGGQSGAFYQNASNLNAGTLPSARLSGSYSNTLQLTNSLNILTGTHSGNGTSLTSLSASNISVGTLPDARLSSNVATLNSVQTFTAGKVFSAAPAFSAAGSPFTVSNTGLVTNLNADLLDGLSSSAFLQAVPNPLNLVGSNAANPIIRGENTSLTDGSSGLYGYASAAGSLTYGAVGVSEGTSGIGVLGLALANTGVTSGIEGRADSSSGAGVRGTAATYGVRGEASGTSGRGVFGRANATSGDARGVYGVSDSPTGTGVYGYAITTVGVNYGVYGRTDSSSGTGVYGHVENGSGVVSGVRGETNSSSGRGVFGVANALSGTTYGGRFENDSTSGRGVFAWATSSTGTTYGVSGRTDSSAGRGVYGDATADTGTNYGVYGETDSVSGRGVYGEATAATGTAYGGEFVTNSSSSAAAGVVGVSLNANFGGYGVFGRNFGQSGRGVYGQSYNDTGTTYGVYGSSVSGTGFGVFSGGDFGASGIKAFRIDHPDDPENKYLLHYSAESPEVINFYRGTVVLDDSGEATVTLPRYFARINRNPSYSLTAVGSAMPALHVAVEIDDAVMRRGVSADASASDEACSFRIAGGVPFGKVSWRVEAERFDAYTRARPPQVEVPKQGIERGTYQHPELYGQPPERGMNPVSAPREHHPAGPERSRDEQPR